MLFKKLFLALATFWLASGALCAQPVAQTRCPLQPFSQSLPESKEQRLSELEKLDQFADVCLTRADYYAYKGSLLVSLGRGLQAVEALERALLLEPNLPGVQFDYAQALALSGDRHSAAQLLEQLIARQDIHPQFRDYLIREQENLSRLQWGLSVRASSQLGYETNLNSAPAERFFTLTPASGDVVLELDDRSQRRSGFALLNAVSLSGTADLGAGQALQAFGGLRARVSPNQTHYQQAEGALQWRGADMGYEGFASGFRPSARVGLSHLQFNGAAVFQAPRAELGVEIPLREACFARSAFVGEFRRFPQAEIQDGNYRGLLVSAHCLINSSVLSFQLGSGKDLALDNARSGGDQARWEASVIWSQDLGWAGLMLVGSLARLKDERGYSPLLGNGAIRSLERRFARFELFRPINKRLEWYWSGEVSEQTGNLSLFRLTTRALYAGLRLRLD